VKTKGARMMRFHDLRATGITYLALRGDSDHQVRDRAGHTDFKTTLEYIRRGQHAFGVRMGDPFAPLPVALLGDFASAIASGDQGDDSNGSQISLAATGSDAGWSPPLPLPGSAAAAEKPPLADAYTALGVVAATLADANQTQPDEREAFALALLECSPGAYPPARPLTKTRPAGYVARKRVAR
jgi:hypothetical protein